MNHCVDAGVTGPTDSIGDRVWYDANRDGIQDPGEPGIGGVVATLVTSAGATVGTTITDSQGVYSFTGLSNGTYHVCFDRTTLPSQYSDGTFTRRNAASGNGTDSAADQNTVCTGDVTVGPGHRQHLTRDAGIVTPPNVLGDRVWYDKNRNGVQDLGEPGVGGVKVRAISAGGATVGTATTDSQGVYLFTGLPDGAYHACFDRTTFPKGYALTITNAHGGNGTDSAADRKTGCTGDVTLGAGHRQDLTRDAGLAKVDNGSGGSNGSANIGRLARTGLDLPTTSLPGLGLAALAAAMYLLLRRRKSPTA